MPALFEITVLRTVLGSWGFEVFPPRGPPRVRLSGTSLLLPASTPQIFLPCSFYAEAILEDLLPKLETQNNYSFSGDKRRCWGAPRKLQATTVQGHEFPTGHIFLGQQFSHRNLPKLMF